MRDAAVRKITAEARRVEVEVETQEFKLLAEKTNLLLDLKERMDDPEAVQALERRLSRAVSDMLRIDNREGEAVDVIELGRRSICVARGALDLFERGAILERAGDCSATRSRACSRESWLTSCCSAFERSMLDGRRLMSCALVGWITLQGELRSRARS
jgi:hypothetical protein